MKVTKQSENKEHIMNPEIITYSKFPLDGVGEARCEEWGSGDGYDIWIDNTKIELTYQEFEALSAIVGLRRLEALLKD